MAGRFSKAEIKDKLQRSAFRLVAAGGVESVTVRKVTAGCGLSDPYIYQCYSDMTELMTDAFLRTDREIADLTASVIKTKMQPGAAYLEENCWLLWSEYWSFLMSDPEKIIYYWRFYQSGYYTKELLTQRRENFQVFTSFLYSAGKQTGLNQYGDLAAAVSCIIDNTVSAVVKMHLGYLREEDISPQVIYGSAFSYLMHLACIDVWACIRRRNGENRA